MSPPTTLGSAPSRPATDHEHARAAQLRTCASRRWSPGDADVGDQLGAASHDLRRDERLLGHRQVGGAGAHHEHAAARPRAGGVRSTNERARAPSARRAGTRARSAVALLLADAGRQHDAATRRKRRSTIATQLLRRLALAEDHLGEAGAQRALVVERRELEPLDRRLGDPTSRPAAGDSAPRRTARRRASSSAGRNRGSGRARVAAPGLVRLTLAALELRRGTRRAARRISVHGAGAVHLLAHLARCAGRPLTYQATCLRISRAAHSGPTLVDHHRQVADARPRAARRPSAAPASRRARGRRARGGTPRDRRTPRGPASPRRSRSSRACAARPRGSRTSPLPITGIPTACLASPIISQCAVPSNFSARVRAWIATAAAPASSSARHTSTTLRELPSQPSRILAVTGRRSPRPCGSRSRGSAARPGAAPRRRSGSPPCAPGSPC